MDCLKGPCLQEAGAEASSEVDGAQGRDRDGAGQEGTRGVLCPLGKVSGPCLYRTQMLGSSEPETDRTGSFVGHLISKRVSRVP